MDKFAIKLRNARKQRTKVNRLATIITRAYNRLEYTIQCVNSVRNNTGYDNYEHLIVNNNSIDGTGEWLDWISTMPNMWYNKVRPIHLNENRGDWGGMTAGYDYIDDEVSYVAQLDNDILVPDRWLIRMIGLLEATGMNVVMLKRAGVKMHINPRNMRKITLDNTVLEYGDVNHAVACWVARAGLFLNVHNYDNCKPFTGDNGGVVKIMNMECVQIDGWNSRKKNYIQHDKYLPYRDHLRGYRHGQV